jgi:hypothetical protein
MPYKWLTAGSAEAIEYYDKAIKIDIHMVSPSNSPRRFVYHTTSGAYHTYDIPHDHSDERKSDGVLVIGFRFRRVEKWYNGGNGQLLNPAPLFLLTLNIERRYNKSGVRWLSIGVSIIIMLLAVIDANEVLATSNTPPFNSTAAMTQINAAKISTNTRSLVVAQSPFYESDVGKLIGQVVSNSAGPQVQVSVVVGHGILTTKDGQMATWVAYDIGRIKANTGVTTFNGIMFFGTNSTGSLAFLNNLAGLYVTQTNSNMRTTKIWEWK